MFERFSAGLEVRAEGRRLSGVVLKYGDVSPSHRERFEPGSIRFAKAVHADLFHDPERAFAWMPGGGLIVTQGRESVGMTAEVPPIPAGDRALAEVRSGHATGLSVEFKAEAERREGGLRVIERAVLHGIGLVKKPSYLQSQVEARAGKAFLRASMSPGKRYSCKCVDPACEIELKPEAVDSIVRQADENDILAHVGSLSGRDVLASTSAGTLRLAKDGDRLAIHLSESVAETPAGRDLAETSKAAGGPVVRPIIDMALSQYEDQDGVRVYSQPILRSILIKHVSGPGYAGWTPASVAEPKAEARRSERKKVRVYL